MILLSKTKIDELRQEYENLRRSFLKENEEEALRGGPMDSFKEAASFNISKEAKAKRIDELNKILKEAKELPKIIAGDLIKIGKRFSLKNKLETREYTLVDPEEADPSKNKISINSPLGKAVLNKKFGHRVRIAGKIFIINNVR